MTLEVGTRLGPYEVLSVVGTGGMGEVYRARDPRLGREVAVKVLPALFDPDRLRRFEREAQAAGGLNHPNITAVYDVGTQEGAPYVVMELLRGETLRQRLNSGPIPARKAIDYGIQISRGLAAAHENGIVHRDLKPENLFLTQDGRIKILDFGLAKLTQSRAESLLTDAKTATQDTEPGVVLGTLGYMSPEQVKGQAADARSDIFSFGAILYEMLSGKRAFRGDSPAETMSAILKEDAPELSAADKKIAPGVERIMRHCLEKKPAERVHSAHDLAFELEALSGISEPIGATIVAAHRTSVPWIVAGAAALGALVFGAVSQLARNKAVQASPPSFQQLTFRRGEILSARFASDDSVIYSASWDGDPLDIFSTRTDQPEPRSLALAGVDVMAISQRGEMLVSLNRRLVQPYVRVGTLAQLSIGGGVSPRELSDDIQWADWAPHSEELAIVRDLEQHARLEYPPGQVIYQTQGWLSHPRVSPDKKYVAFVEHPVRYDDGGVVAIVDRERRKRTLSRHFQSAFGLAWRPDGGEVWVTAADFGAKRVLRAVSLAGNERALLHVPETLTLQDIATDGRVLISSNAHRSGILARAPGEQTERELGWRTYSVAWDISDDGKKVLFLEAGEGSSPGYDLYIRGTDGSPPVRLGEGAPRDFSPDARWVLAQITAPTSEFVLYPTAAGERKVLPTGELDLGVVTGQYLPDGKQIVFTARESGGATRLFLMDLATNRFRAASPEGYSSFIRGVSPDGRWVVVRGPDLKLYLHPLGGGNPVPIPGVSSDETPSGWSEDGRFLYVYRRRDLPSRVFMLEVASGKRSLWKEIMPRDPAGISNLSVLPTPDGKAYVCNYVRTLSDLYIVNGIR